MHYPGDQIARAAFDVMTRRCWMPYPVLNGKWGVAARDHDQPPTPLIYWPEETPWADPFTALVEADRFWVERMEVSPCTP